MNKYLRIIFLWILLLGVTSCEVLFKDRYFEVHLNRKIENCGNHLPIGQADKYILTRYADSYDFKGKTFKISENLIFKKKSKLSIFTDYRFSDRLFENDFNLIFKNNNYYIFAYEFNNFPDKKYFKNIIYFQINRLSKEIDMTTFYIYSEEAYLVYKKINLKNFNDEKDEIGRSIAYFYINALTERKVKENQSFAQFTDLAGCELEEVDIKPKI